MIYDVDLDLILGSVCFVDIECLGDVVLDGWDGDCIVFSY